MKMRRFLFIIVMLSASCMHADEDRAKCEAFPAQDSCIKSLVEIASIKTNLDACCNELSNKFAMLLSEVEKIVASFGPCALVTTIIESGFVINQPGKYCLGVDLTSGALNRITINADNVILDLNNHLISGGNNGITISNQRNVVIMNGIIQNAGTNGINVAAGSSSILVSNVEFRDNISGILFNQVTGFKLVDCEFVTNGVNPAIDVNTSNNGIITSCFLHENAGSSALSVRGGSSKIFIGDVFVSNHSNSTADFSIDASSNINCKGCSVSGSTGGSGKFSITDSSNCFFDTCLALNNGAGTGFCVGFRPSNSTGIVFNKCYASRILGTDGVGFQFIDDSTACCMMNCLAIDNSASGVRVEIGATENLFFGNSAIGNTTNGFVDGVNGNGWHANYATSNGTDYVGVPAANIRTYTLNNATLPANTVSWNNIAGV